MQRISTATRFQDKFGPGKDGFRDGDPGLGTASTQLEALWFDNAQEEIANAIEMSGLALNPNDMTQLWQAINARVAAGPFVLKTGDTMTGPLAVPSLGVTGNAGVGGQIAGNSIASDTTISAGTTVYGATGVTSGGLVFVSTVQMGNNDFYVGRHSNSTRAVVFSDQAGIQLGFNEPATALDISMNNTTAVTCTRVDFQGDFYTFYNAFRSGAGPGSNQPVWDTISDVSLKTNINDYTSGLAEICQLRPVTYRFNSDIAAYLRDGGKTHVGLLADEVAAVFPDMVAIKAARLRDNDPTTRDVMTLNIGETHFAFINAFKEIAARLDALEASALAAPPRPTGGLSR